MYSKVMGSPLWHMDPFGWHKCEPEENYMANSIQQLAGQVRNSVSGWQLYVLLLLKGKQMKIYISFLFGEP